MSIFSRLFGSKEAPEKEPELYEGFSIHAEPIKDGHSWRVAARIEKDVAGEIKTHQMIRADTIEGHDAATEASVRKAKQMIDEQGDGIFN